jgi:hypothetical protein
MIVNFVPLAVVGAVLVAIVIAMIVWRKVVSSREDDSIHVLEDSDMVQGQVAVAKKLAVIDRWGKVATVITALYLLGVAGVYFYQVWERSSSTTGI